MILESLTCAENPSCLNHFVKRLEFPPNILYPLVCAIDELISGESSSKSVPVRGGQSAISVTSDLVGGKQYISFIQENTISEMRKAALAVGFPKNFPLPPSEPRDRCDHIFIPRDEAIIFAHLLNKINTFTKIQYEIKVQKYATFKIVSRKTQEMKSISKQDYYMLLLDAFFSLNVSERYELPAYIVLSDFFREYNQEPYSLYYQSYCVCPSINYPRKCEVC